MGWVSLILTIIKVALDVWKGERVPDAITQRYAVKLQKKKHEALDAAEKIFRYTDKIAPKHLSKKEYKSYWKLRNVFDDND